MLELARAWAAELDEALGVCSVVVFGSVARGDFNVWSDVDVLVVADHLPKSWLDRIALLSVSRPPRLSPIAWTPEEFRCEVDRRNPIATEARAAGIVVRGDDLARLGAAS